MKVQEFRGELSLINSAGISFLVFQYDRASFQPMSLNVAC